MENSENVISVKSQIVTIFDDPVNYNVKHPTARKWTLYYDIPSAKITNKNWAENIQTVSSINTIEDFWYVYNNIKFASNISFGSNYYFFQEGINPEWEDPANKNGGKWCIQFKKTSRTAPHLNKAWLYSMLHCIGELWENNEKDCAYQVCGVIVNVRKFQDKINIWLRDKSNTRVIDFIENKIKEIIDNTDSQSPVITWTAHNQN